MNYQGLYGVMPMPPMSNLGGYSVMGAGPTNMKPAVKPQPPARQKGPLEKIADNAVIAAAANKTLASDVLVSFLKENPPEKVTDVVDFKYALLSIIAYGEESKSLLPGEYKEFADAIKSEGAKKAAEMACTLLGASMGTSMTTKILIGVGIVGVVGVGFYAYKQKKSKSKSRR